MRAKETNINFKVAKQVLVEEPSICPLCNHALKPFKLSASEYFDENENVYIAILYLCKACFGTFFSRHLVAVHQQLIAEPKLIEVSPRKFAKRGFEQRIIDLSPSFVKIYNQSLQAESEGLDEIAGMGLRKSIEFLIKDYLIKIEPTGSDIIKKMELGNCIANRVKNENIKSLALRSVWIGNDFTHYTRRFEDKDIEDLHKFIEAIVYWVNMELITTEALQIDSKGRP
jgi:hypothetical protein